MKRFFALSRTTHGVLDIATPGFCTLLCLGSFPQWQIILLSLITAFAAYTSIYALNDLVGIAVDREKFAGGINSGYSVEASDVRYPLAQKVLSYRDGLIWFVAWFGLALIGSYLLNASIVIILVAAVILEVVYCLLLKITYLRTLVSGMVKSCGPLAAVFVVDRHPSPISPSTNICLGILLGNRRAKYSRQTGTIPSKTGASMPKRFPSTLAPKEQGLLFLLR